MQVDPINPMLKPTGTKRLNLDNDKLLSRFAFKFNLRRYNLEKSAQDESAVEAAADELAATMKEIREEDEAAGLLKYNPVGRCRLNR